MRYHFTRWWWRWGVRVSCVGAPRAHATGELEESQLSTHTHERLHTRGWIESQTHINLRVARAALPVHSWGLHSVFPLVSGGRKMALLDYLILLLWPTNPSLLTPAGLAPLSIQSQCNLRTGFILILWLWQIVQSRHASGDRNILKFCNESVLSVNVRNEGESMCLLREGSLRQAHSSRTICLAKTGFLK